MNAMLLCALALAAAPTIQLRDDNVEVAGLAAESLRAAAEWKPDAGSWRRVLAVYVDAGNKDGPPMLGSYRIDKGVLRFTPRFPLARGVRYRAVLDPSALPGGSGKRLEAALSLPRPERKPTAVVRQVYPTSDRLPENQLKFYLHFSAPMAQGGSYRHIKLLDDKGAAIEWPWLELDQELWDPSGTRFTLFLDPGRIKRGLKPREDVGPVLEEGKRYTLVLDRGWNDAEGAPLKEGFKKTFTVGKPDEAQPDVKTWKLAAPAAGTREPLRVTFPKSMDHALAERMVWVAGAGGKKIAGKVEITDRETRWSFTPDQPWAAGAYHLVADTRFEDLAGNSLGRPFEVDVLRPVERTVKTETLQVPFAIKK